MDFAKNYNTEATINIQDTEINVVNPFKSPEYQAGIAKHIRDKTINDETTRDLIAEHIITGWKNLHFGVDKQGNLKEVKYSKKSCRKLLDISEAFRESVLFAAFNKSTFESAITGDFDLGN